MGTSQLWPERQRRFCCGARFLEVFAPLDPPLMAMKYNVRACNT